MGSPPFSSGIGDEYIVPISRVKATLATAYVISKRGAQDFPPKKCDTMQAMFKLKRAYDPPEGNDGARFLVDRLWPRGVKKESLKIKLWLKEVSPSEALRREFHSHPEKWPEFRRRYFKELDDHPEAWKPLIDAAQKGPVTLVYAARDSTHNNAAALAEYLATRHKGTSIG
jgi:uncharacterized protein YeaO (DUF488 family)